jgi:NDP-sugar pyrophosphorylase family protein
MSLTALPSHEKKPMKALILAAGLGTRLRPMTDNMPKALVRVKGKTLLEHSFDHLKANGIRDVIINIHHFPGMIKEFLKMHDNFGLNISISDESEELLETGGGLKKAACFFNDGKPFLVRNADIIADIDLTGLYHYHTRHSALATLAVRNRETSRYFLFDDQLFLSGWENLKTGERKITRQVESYVPLAFSGIQIIDPALFPLITETGKFSLTELYLRLSGSFKIAGYLDDLSFWMDGGKLN